MTFPCVTWSRVLSHDATQALVLTTGILRPGHSFLAYPLLQDQWKAI